MPSIVLDICDMKSEDFGMAELEEWIVFFEEKGCGEWAGVADLRLSLKDAYTGVAIPLRTGSEENEAMLRMALALGEELRKFKKHPTLSLFFAYSLSAIQADANAWKMERCIVDSEAVSWGLRNSSFFLGN